MRESFHPANLAFVAIVATAFVFAVNWGLRSVNLGAFQA
jgi:hypothetical protein